MGNLFPAFMSKQFLPMEGTPAKKVKVQEASLPSPPLRVIIIERINVRKYADGTKFAVTYGLLANDDFKTVHQDIFPEKFFGQMARVPKTFYVTNYSLFSDGMLKLTNKSTVMETTDIINDVVKGTIDNFVSPTEVELATVLTKKKGDRVTVEGRISKVSDVLDSPSSKRRIYTLTKGEFKMEVKIWNEKLNEIRMFEQEDVLIRYLEVHEYKGRVSLNSTVSTTVEVVREDIILEGIINAASFEGGKMTLMVNADVYNISNELMDEVFQDRKFKGNHQFKGTMRNDRITGVI